jgi:hypothetical protein
VCLNLQKYLYEFRTPDLERFPIMTLALREPLKPLNAAASAHMAIGKSSFANTHWDCFAKVRRYMHGCLSKVLW